MKEAEIFESWINNLVEGTWSLPETPEQQEKLKELMSQPLAAGPDGTNASEQLYDIIGDDVLFDAINDVAAKDPDANIWDDEAVQRRMEDLGIYVVNPTEGDEVAPVADTQDTGVPDGGTIAPQGTVPPVQESLNAMRRAAGLAESMLDESGETLDHILNRFKFEVKSFKEGGELDTDLYRALEDYYKDTGALPYEVVSRGDPYNWVSDKLGQHLGIDEGVLGALGGAAIGAVTGGPLGALVGGAAGQDLTKGGSSVIEGSCNATMEGEYCPEHGLAECGTTAGGMAPVVMGEMDKPPHDDAINYNAAITGSYYESKEGDTMLARMKSLALIK